MRSSSRTLLVVGAVAAGVYLLTRGTSDALLKARAEEYVRENILRPVGWDSAVLMATAVDRLPDTGQLIVPVRVLSGGPPSGPSVYIVYFSDDGTPETAW